MRIDCFWPFLFCLHLFPRVNGGDYCLKNDCSPRTFRLKVSTTRGNEEEEGQQGQNNQRIIEESEVKNKCWRYTWLGPINENTNETAACDYSPENEHIPCFEPIVWTEDPNKFNQPDLSDLAEKCEQGQSIQHKICVPFCTRNEGTCVKMTYYRRDSERSIQKTVSFCGQGTLVTSDNADIKSGCYMQENNEEGLDVEACFCEEDGCNGCSNRVAHHLIIFVSSLILMLIH